MDRHSFDGSLIAGNDRLEDVFPAIGAVNVARMERASFQIPELIEHEERMVTRAAEVAVPNAALLIGMRWAYTRIYIKHDAVT